MSTKKVTVHLEIEEKLGWELRNAIAFAIRNGWGKSKAERERLYEFGEHALLRALLEAK